MSPPFRETITCEASAYEMTQTEIVQVCVWNDCVRKVKLYSFVQPF